MIGRTMAVAVLAAGMGTTMAAAQEGWRVAARQDWCGERDGDPDRARFCEVRETAWRATGRLAVDASPNGGIQVSAGSADEVRLQVKVMAVADDEAEARRLVSAVRIQTGDDVRAQGPSMARREWWSASFRLTVPERTDLDLRSFNGGLSLTGVRGHTELQTTNGGIHLEDAGGSIHGRTTNGGVHVALTGSQWDGEGLDVVTTNGGVTLDVPQDFNAHLETRTVNGGVRMDFPVKVQGRLSHQLATDLGSGGPTIRAFTTNGGVTVRRR